jgi:hypothetical protein
MRMRTTSVCELGTPEKLAVTRTYIFMIRTYGKKRRKRHGRYFHIISVYFPMKASHQTIS